MYFIVITFEKVENKNRYDWKNIDKKINNYRKAV